MAEKRLTREELDQVGLDCIEIDWDNTQKLTALFRHFSKQGESLPASGVNDKGDLIPNLSLLARLGKVVQGKQVFKALYARTELNNAIVTCGIEDINQKTDESDEVTLVREKLQDTVDSVRRNASNTDKKLQSALDKVQQITEENTQLKNDKNLLKQELLITQTKLNIANKRIFNVFEHECINLKRTR